MKKLLAMVLAAVMLTAIAVLPAGAVSTGWGDNLLTNGSFESVTEVDGVFQFDGNWAKLDGKNFGTIVQKGTKLTTTGGVETEVNPPDGQYCMRIEWGQGAGISFEGENSVLKPGKNYVLSFYYWADSATYPRMIPMSTFAPINIGDYSNAAVPNGVAKDWAQYTFYFTVPSNAETYGETGCVPFAMYFAGNYTNWGTTFYDGVVLKEVGDIDLMISNQTVFDWMTGYNVDTSGNTTNTWNRSYTALTSSIKNVGDNKALIVRPYVLANLSPLKEVGKTFSVISHYVPSSVSEEKVSMMLCVYKTEKGTNKKQLVKLLPWEQTYQAKLVAEDLTNGTTTYYKKDDYVFDDYSGQASFMHLHGSAPNLGFRYKVIDISDLFSGDTLVDNATHTYTVQAMAWSDIAGLRAIGNAVEVESK